MFKIFFVGLPMLFASLFSFFGGNSDPNKKNEALMADIVNISTKQLSKRYGLVPVGRGGGNVDYKSKREFIAFQLQHKLTKDEARILIVEIIELFLHNINNTPEISPYLYDDPFTYKNLEVVIYLSNVDGSKIYDPELGLVALTERGNAKFVTYEFGKLCSYATNEEEPYEESYRLATGREYSESR